MVNLSYTTLRACDSAEILSYFSSSFGYKLCSCYSSSHYREPFVYKQKFDMLSSGMNLITTIIGFGMSATFIVFVCTRLFCGRLRQFEARQMFEIHSRIDLELAAHQNNGLAPVVVAAIPTMKFNREAFSSMEDAQCTICLAEYQDKEVLRIMPKCGHSFHLSCIDVWLRRQSTCPVCRLAVQESTAAEHVRSALPQSQPWLLPGAASSELNHGSQIHSNPISIELDSGVARELRSP